MSSIASDWVSETRFGKWFLSTEIWFREVLSPAIVGLREIAGPALPPTFNRLMDVGCGHGVAFPLIVKYFAPREIIAVDVDPAMLDGEREAGAQCNVPVTVKACSVTKLELSDNSVDAILCHQLIHHVANQEGALRELYRVLAPGGYLFLSESCAAFINTQTVRWLFRHPKGVQRQAEGYLAMVEEAGFAFHAARDARLSTPWWSLRDFGITRRLGLVRKPPIPTELLLVARK
jgi:SAM-dependent methyltransferase